MRYFAHDAVRKAEFGGKNQRHSVGFFAVLGGKTPDEQHNEDWENYLPVVLDKFHPVYFRISGELWQSLELPRFTDGDFSVKLDSISGPVV